MNSEELCMALLRAESEAEVEEVLSAATPTAGKITWHPLDGRDTNFNVVTNQAATGAKALTELCTNMVDAILLRHAHEARITPTSDSAPQTVTEAVRELVKLRGAPSGILAEVDNAAYLREYAEANLVIGVTGATDACFTFVDTGEGQLANDFEDTFLSLSSGHKSEISFVQGKYNMGSAGVLSFCGRRWFKLIVSKRFDRSGPWGWSLVRRRPSSGTPVAEYLKLDDQIPRFEREELQPLHLSNGESGVEIVIGERRRIRFRTDPLNDWLTRPDNRGSVTFVRQDGAVAGFGFRAELLDGSLVVTIEAAQGQVSMGETITTEIGLVDDSMSQPVTDSVVFHVVESRQQRPGGGDGQRRRPHGDDDDHGSAEERGLPQTQWITKDGRTIGEEETIPWSDIDDDFNDQDGGQVQELKADEKLYRINYDNAHFQHFLIRERTDVEKRVLTEQYRLSLLILMMGFEDAYSRLRSSPSEVDWAEWDDQIRRLVSQGAATVVMSIAKTLPTLVTADTIGDPDDD